MSSDETKVFGCVGIIVAVVLAAIIGGFAASVAWGWFMVPLGVPDVTIPQAIGLSLLSSLLIGGNRPSDDEEPIIMLGRAILSPLFTLGIAWIVMLFM